MSCQLPDGKSGYKWGHHGKCYASRIDAEKQAAAAHANGFTGDKMPEFCEFCKAKLNGDDFLIRSGKVACPDCAMKIDIRGRRDGSIAQDESLRSYDADGRMHVKRSHISKATVNPYYGSEIPGWYSLGLSPNKIYYLLRDPKELEKAAPTFARLPILSKHIPISANKLPEELIIGSIGSDISFNAPYLDADLCFWKNDAIGAIEAETIKELSSAYRYTPDMTPGEYEGEPYDGIMRNIIGNHLCLVEDGRAGSDVVVADSNPFTEENRMTKLGKALLKALSLASPKLAQDSALPALLKDVKAKGFDKAAFKTKLIAMDAELPPEQLDAVIDALLDVEQNPTPIEPVPPAVAAGDDDLSEYDKEPESEEEKKERLKKRKEKATAAKPPAVDGPPTVKGSLPPSLGGTFTGDDGKKLEAAMDALKKELRDADEARRLVRPVVGEVIAQDSASGIYKFALDHLGVKHEGIEDAIALKALFGVATANKTATGPVKVAQDSATLVQKFPAAARFRQA